ncbi:DUF3425 domain-containing protein [Aspergillus homomorphus CBS 101889]|uniref:Uncharacterized protein n=1 Tax=Aspergillus homomorphus (strain CBS 101889) TaxID=1450537 RepID=A0A395I7G9_ASPHC|nr:hypothetical protein BO97DRAFT_440472 [Aspergillus homomorphus CBS 101889]RAL15856.1 hypothetical protein BO97DRAFT_440472 [Aspergillus homomorphus CBS 101889]
MAGVPRPHHLRVRHELSASDYGQIQHAHPFGIDLLLWPQLRAYLAGNWHKYDYGEWTGYLGCCVKARWPWGEGILGRDQLDELQIRPDFFDIFNNGCGWGLTSEFIVRYPELLEIMVVEEVRFPEHGRTPMFFSGTMACHR